jgi:hypothetical protein
MSEPSHPHAQPTTRVEPSLVITLSARSYVRDRCSGGNCADPSTIPGHPLHLRNSSGESGEVDEGSLSRLMRGAGARALRKHPRALRKHPRAVRRLCAGRPEEGCLGRRGRGKSTLALCLQQKSTRRERVGASRMGGHALAGSSASRGKSRDMDEFQTVWGAWRTYHMSFSHRLGEFKRFFGH